MCFLSQLPDFAERARTSPNLVGKGKSGECLCQMVESPRNTLCGKSLPHGGNKARLAGLLKAIQVIMTPGRIVHKE